MSRLLAVACLLLAACSKTEPAPAGSGAKTLGTVPLAAFASFEAWCGRLSKGACKGEWEGHPPGTSALGAYRFVRVEYPEPKDGQGPVVDVFFELKTSRGFAYHLLGSTRTGKVTNSVMVKEVVDRPGALELRVVYRTAPRFSYSDYYGSSFILEGPSGLAVVEVALGKIVGDINTGNTTGTIGEAQWQVGKVRVKGASIPDGEWSVSPQ